MVANVGEITYTVDANTRPLLEAEKVVDKSAGRMADDLNKVDKSSDKLSKGLRKTGRNAASLKGEVVRLSATVSPLSAAIKGVNQQIIAGTSAFGQSEQKITSVIAKTNAYGQSVQNARLRTTLFNRGVRDIRAGFATFTPEVQRTRAGVAKVGESAKKTTKNFKAMRGVTGQLGFQIQDLAVQLQGGQNAIVAITQQGSQLAGAFGPGGAIIGAVLAVSGALTTALVPGLFDSSDGMKKLSDEAQELRKSLASLALFELTDAAFKSSERVSELEQQLAKAKKRVDALGGVQIGAGLRKQAEAAKKEFEDINRELIFEQNTLKQINAQSTVTLKTSQSAQESVVKGLRAEAIERANIIKGQQKLAGVEATLDLPLERIQRQFEERNDIIQAETEKGSALQQDLVLRNAQLLLSQIGAINDKELQQEQTKLAALNKMRQEAFTTATAAQLGITEQTVERLDAIAAAGANASLSLKDAWTNNMLDVGDSIGDTLARAIVDGESLSQTLRGVAKSFLTEMLSSLIKVGAQMVINQAIGTAGAAAATATAVAAGSASAAAWAPAAALASLASFGANAAPAAAGIASTVALSQGLALAGGKLHGGPVGPGRAFPVTEDGRPEIFSDGNRQFLIPGSRGEVISNKDMGGGDPAININFNVQNSSPGASFEVTGVRQQGTEVTIDAIVSDIRTGNGPVSRALGESTNVTRKSI
jgi:hypothetical protein